MKNSRDELARAFRNQNPRTVSKTNESDRVGDRTLRYSELPDDKNSRTTVGINSKRLNYIKRYILDNEGLNFQEVVNDALEQYFNEKQK
jgi:predicted DNA binding CopG/RHH family protein